MQRLMLNITELEVIEILNAICYFINSIIWNDCNLYNRKQAEKYFNFEPGEYTNQLDNLIRLRDIISVQANKDIYNCINDNFFIGQRQYLISKKYDFLYNKQKLDETIKLYLENKNKENKNICYNYKNAKLEYIRNRLKI